MKRDLLVALAAALVFLAGVWSAATIRLQTDLLPLFPPGLPSMQALQALEQSLDEDELQIVPAPGTSLAPEALTSLAERLATVPNVEVAEVTPRPPFRLDRFVALALAGAPPDRWSELRATLHSPETLATRLSATQDSLAGALDPGAIALATLDPFGLLEFAPGGGEAGASFAELPPLVRVRSESPLTGYAEAEPFVRAVREAVAAFLAEQRASADALLVTGRPAYLAEISARMRSDMIRMVAAAVLAISLAFWIYYRSLRPLAWILCVQALAILGAMVLARLAFRELNAIGIGFAAILLGVGMDYCILVYHHFASGHTRTSAHWPVLLRAITLSAVTTAATFGVLAFSSFPGLRQFALLVAAGLLFTAFFALTLLASRLERRPPKLPAWLTPASDAAAAGLRRRRLLVLTTFGVLLAIGWGSLATGHAFFDGDLRRLRPPDLAAERGQEALLHLYANSAQPTAPPAHDLDRNLADWQPPDESMLRDALTRAGLDPAVWGAATFAVLREITALRDAPPALREVFAGGSDALWPRFREELTATATREAGWLSFAMFACVLGLCIAAHRSVRLVGLNLAALTAALGTLLALLVLTGARMSPLSLLCIPLVIGLSIDYALHFLLAHEETQGDLRATFRHLAAPVSLTAIASLCGFSAPMLSAQPALRNFGLVMDLGALAAAASALVLLPCLDWRATGPPRFPFFHAARGYAVGRFFGSWAPRWLTHPIAAGISLLYARLQPARLAAVRANLRLLHGREVSDAESRAVFAEFGRTMADYFHLAARPLAAAQALITEHAGFEHFGTVRAHGRGGLLLTPHLSFFELGAAAAREIGVELVALTLAESTPALTDWRAAYRARWGIRTVEVGGDDQFAFVEIARELDAGRLVAALVDRPNAAKAYPVRFPGGESAFSGAVLLLAMAQRCPVVPVTTTRKADGTYRVEAHPPFFVERVRGSDSNALITHHCQHLADVFTPILQQHPDQWFHFVPLTRLPPRS